MLYKVVLIIINSLINKELIIFYLLPMIKAIYNSI